MQERRHEPLVSYSDQFPTDAAGLPEARASEIVELAHDDEFDLRIAPVAKRLGEATARMLAYNGSIPGPTLRVAEGARPLSMSSTRPISRRPSTGTACGSTTAMTARTRHRRRSPSAEVLLPAGVSGPGRLLVPPAHPRGLRPGDGPVRQHPRRSGRSRLLAAGASRDAADARRRSGRGWQGRAVQPRRDDVRSDGTVRQRSARRRRDRPRAERAARRGRPPLPDQHGQHARLQRCTARRAHEARRRRQRPIRARAVRRLGHPCAVRTRHARRALRRSPGS